MGAGAPVPHPKRNCQQMREKLRREKEREMVGVKDEKKRHLDPISSQVNSHFIF